jgi:hypothetical protein
VDGANEAFRHFPFPEAHGHARESLKDGRPLGSARTLKNMIAAAFSELTANLLFFIVHGIQKRRKHFGSMHLQLDAARVRLAFGKAIVILQKMIKVITAPRSYSEGRFMAIIRIDLGPVTRFTDDLNCPVAETFSQGPSSGGALLLQETLRLNYHSVPYFWLPSVL